jgi:hypothetical protein
MIEVSLIEFRLQKGFYYPGLLKISYVSQIQATKDTYPISINTSPLLRHVTRFDSFFYITNLLVIFFFLGYSLQVVTRTTTITRQLPPPPTSHPSSTWLATASLFRFLFYFFLSFFCPIFIFFLLILCDHSRTCQ